MKYNKKIGKYNDLIDKGNKRENNNGAWGIVGAAAFACALIWFGWKLALILVLFALWIKLGNKNNID